MGKVVAICSGKGGTGKTSSAAAISAALAGRGRKCLVIDLDIGLRNLDLVLGVSGSAVFDISDVLSGSVDLDEAVCTHPLLPGLYVLPAPVSKSISDIDSGALSALLRRAKESYDYVLLDAPAGIGRGFELAVRDADEIIIVANPDSSSLRDAGRAVEEAEKFTSVQPRLLVNRLKRSGLRFSGRNVDDIIDTVGARLIGIVRDDSDVSLSGDAGIPLSLFRVSGARSAAAQFARIAARIDGEKLRLGRI